MSQQEDAQSDSAIGVTLTEIDVVIVTGLGQNVKPQRLRRFRFLGDSWESGYDATTLRRFRRAAQTSSVTLDLFMPTLSPR